MKMTNEELLERAKETFPKTPFATKEPKYFAKFGDVLLPLINKRALMQIAGGKFPITTEGEYTYVICDELLANPNL